MAERAKSSYKPVQATISEKLWKTSRGEDGVCCRRQHDTSGRAHHSGRGWGQAMTSLDSFKCRKILKVGTKSYVYYSLAAAEKNGLRGIARLPFSLKVLLENMLRHEDGRSVTKEDIQGFAQWLKTKTSDRGDSVPPRAGADAGLHRRSGRGRPRRHARRDEAPRRRSEEDQPAGSSRPRHRPFGRGHVFRQQRRVQEERRGGVQAEPGALPLPQMGAALVRGFPRRATGHRHLPSGEPRIPVAHRLDRARKPRSSTARRPRSKSLIRTRSSAPIRTPPW